MTLLAQISSEIGLLYNGATLTGILLFMVRISGRLARVETKFEDLPCKTVAIKQPTCKP